MSEYDFTYPTFEVAICLQNSFDLSSGHERRKEGDIIGFRKLGQCNCIGPAETTHFLWLRLEGEEESIMRLLSMELTDPDESEATFDKRRFNVPLDRLKLVFPGLNIARCRDLGDAYQPFLVIAEDNLVFLTEEKPLDVSGLVYDKYFGEYL